MLSKVRKFLRKNKRLLKVGIIFILLLVLVVALYKVLFYSSAESSIYGERLRDIKESEFKKEEKEEIIEKSSEINGISTVKISVKGRLIKLIINYEENVSIDDIKNSMNSMLGYFSETVKGYYDITFYAKQNKEDKESYPIIGYKHKNKENISFDEL